MVVTKIVDELSIFMTGLIIKAISGFYYVKIDDQIIECKARGKFRAKGLSPLVGDTVEISVNGKSGSVDSVFERKNFLERPPIANIDKLFIVSSLVTPSPNQLLIDRMIAICEYKNIQPVIVFNKCDLGDLSVYVNKYRNAGYHAYECSAVLGKGITDIIDELTGCISVFTGNSGVGKSSLLNKIFPELNLNTGEVSEKLGRGRHTTRHTELFQHSYSGYVADTPGFSSLQSNCQDLQFRDNLPDFFIEFNPYVSNCRFSDCHHIGEKGCAVSNAVENGEIDIDRYNSYKAIYNELKDLTPWTLKNSESR